MKTTAQEPTAIETLRAMYRNVRAGEKLDAATYVDALLACASDGENTWKIERAFEALGYYTRLDVVGQTPRAASIVRAAKAARGWNGAIRVASLLGLTDVWAAAMTAHFGPSGVHESRRGADGAPTAETLAEFPRVGAAMMEAAQRFENLLGYYKRVNGSNTHYLEQVVRYSAPATAA